MIETSLGFGMGGMGAGASAGGCVFESCLGQAAFGRIAKRDSDSAYKAMAMDITTAGSEMGGDPIGQYRLKVKRARFRDKLTGEIVERETLVSPDFNDEAVAVWTDAGEYGTGTPGEYKNITARADKLAQIDGNASMFWVSSGKEKDGVITPHRAYLWVKNGEEVSAYAYSLSGSKDALSEMLNKLGYADDRGDSLSDRTLVRKGRNNEITHKEVFGAYVSSLTPDELQSAGRSVEYFRQEAELPDSTRQERITLNQINYEKVLKEVYKEDIKQALESIAQGFAAIAVLSEQAIISEEKVTDHRQELIAVTSGQNKQNIIPTKEKEKESAAIQTEKKVIIPPVFVQGIIGIAKNIIKDGINIEKDQHIRDVRHIISVRKDNSLNQEMEEKPDISSVKLAAIMISLLPDFYDEVIHEIQAHEQLIQRLLFGLEQKGMVPVGIHEKVFINEDMEGKLDGQFFDYKRNLVLRYRTLYLLSKSVILARRVTVRYPSCPESLNHKMILGAPPQSGAYRNDLNGKVSLSAEDGSGQIHETDRVPKRQDGLVIKRDNPESHDLEKALELVYLLQNALKFIEVFGTEKEEIPYKNKLSETDAEVPQETNDLLVDLGKDILTYFFREKENVTYCNFTSIEQSNMYESMMILSLLIASYTDKNTPEGSKKFLAGLIYMEIKNITGKENAESLFFSKFSISLDRLSQYTESLEKILDVFEETMKRLISKEEYSDPKLSILLILGRIKSAERLYPKSIINHTYGSNRVKKKKNITFFPRSAVVYLPKMFKV